MRNKSIIILAVITVAVILAAGITARLRAPQSTVEKTFLFPGLADRINDVARITIKNGRRTLLLEQQQDRWVVPNADNYPALINKVRQTVVGTAELSIVDQKTDNPDFYQRLGVEDPEIEDAQSLLLTLADKSGTPLARLIVGHNRQSASAKPGLYVRYPDSSQALLVEGFLDISSKTEDWIETGLFDIPNTRVQEVRISYPAVDGVKPDDLVISKVVKEQPDFTVNIPDLGNDPSINIVANRISRGLEEMRAEDVHAAQSFTFPENDTITTTVTTFDGQTVTARLVQKDGTHYANFSFVYSPPATPVGEQTTAAVEGDGAQLSPAAEADLLNGKLSPWVYQIPDFLFEALTMRPENFRKPRLIPED